MTIPHDFAPEREQMLREHLSEEELRTLLDRLDARSRNESNLPTVGAVAEATGEQPETVYRVLREIRLQAPQVLEPTAGQQSQAKRNGTLIIAVIAVALVLTLFLMLALMVVVA